MAPVTEIILFFSMLIMLLLSLLCMISLRLILSLLAQDAELMALTPAHPLASNPSAAIHTASTVIPLSMLQARFGNRFLTSSGKTISQAISIAASNPSLPSAISVTHCTAHTSRADCISDGNPLLLVLFQKGCFFQANQLKPAHRLSTSSVLNLCLPFLPFNT